MTDFKAKMHQIRFRLGLRPRPRCGAYSASRPHIWIWGGGRFAEGEGLGWGRGGKGERKGREGREREGPKLLLNQGPSEPCYATGCGPNTWNSLPPAIRNIDSHLHSDEHSSLIYSDSSLVEYRTGASCSWV